MSLHIVFSPGAWAHISSDIFHISLYIHIYIFFLSLSHTSSSAKSTDNILAEALSSLSLQKASRQEISLREPVGANIQALERWSDTSTDCPNRWAAPRRRSQEQQLPVTSTRHEYTRSKHDAPNSVLEPNPFTQLSNLALLSFLESWAQLLPPWTVEQMRFHIFRLGIL